MAENERGIKIREFTMVRIGTYVVQGLRSSIDTSHLCSLRDRHTSASGSPLDIRRFGDTFPDRGRRIYFEYTLDWRDNRCSTYIRVYILRMGYHADSRAGIGTIQHRFVRYILRCCHRGLEHKDRCDRATEFP